MSSLSEVPLRENQNQNVMVLMSDYLLRIGCALLTGVGIGVERQFHQHNAGLRTNMLVAAGAAAFTVISYALTEPGYGDPARVAAQIVTGVGFLGGGLILKEGLNVRGLNTAATIWCSAACGMLSGAGMYTEALLLAGVVLVVHVLFRPLGRWLDRRNMGTCGYTVWVECSSEQVEQVRRLIQDTLVFDNDVRVCSLYYREQQKGMVTVLCEIETFGEHIALLDVTVSRLRSHLGITRAGWEDKGVGREEF